MVQPASASAVVVLIDDSALCLLGRCYVSANGDTHACWHVRPHALTHVSADWVAVVGRSGSDIPFITSYYFPLSPAAAAAAAAVFAPTALFFSSYVSSLFLESNRLLKTGSALAGRKSSRRDFPPFTHKAFTSGKSSASVRFELFLKNSWMRKKLVLQWSRNTHESVAVCLHSTQTNVSALCMLIYLLNAHM